MVTVKVEFLGGLDVIFKSQRQYKLTIPDTNAEGNPSNMGDLIQYIIDNMIETPKDLEVFIDDGSIRPGILTLINDTDWELEGEKEYELESGDIVAFTSTLHGG